MVLLLLSRYISLFLSFLPLSLSTVLRIHQVQKEVQWPSSVSMVTPTDALFVQLCHQRDLAIPQPRCNKKAVALKLASLAQPLLPFFEAQSTNEGALSVRVYIHRVTIETSDPLFGRDEFEAPL